MRIYILRSIRPTGAHRGTARLYHTCCALQMRILKQKPVHPEMQAPCDYSTWTSDVQYSRDRKHCQEFLQYHLFSSLIALILKGEEDLL